MRQFLRPAMRLGSPSIPIKTTDQLQKMREAGKLLREVFDAVGASVAPGISTGELDRIAREAIQGGGAQPSFLGYQGFPGSICASVNEELVHGIPSPKRILAEGDIISVDIGLRLRGWHSDRSFTFAVGKIDDDARRLIEVTEISFWAGAARIRAGARIGEYQSAVQAVVETAGMHVVDKYCSHGIGRSLHEEPQILNCGKADSGFRLKPGMVFALEPMVGWSTRHTQELNDGWTVIMRDRGRCAHYEHTVAVGEQGPEILTLAPEEAERELARGAAWLAPAVGK
jgi:methionyl aminopeptidase